MLPQTPELSPGIQAIAVACGAAIGAVLRWQAGRLLNGLWLGFPLGTLAVNVAGGLLIGIAMAVLARWPDDMLRLILVTGFLGGLTTFSTFSAESLNLIQRLQWGLALAHTLTHVALSLAGAAVGFWLAHRAGA